MSQASIEIKIVMSTNWPFRIDIIQYSIIQNKVFRIEIILSQIALNTYQYITIYRLNQIYILYK